MVGTGKPLQVNSLTCVRVDPTDAVPVMLKLPDATGADPTGALAAEKASPVRPDSVAVSFTRMCFPTCPEVSVRVVLVAPSILVQLSVEVLLVQETH